MKTFIPLAICATILSGTAFGGTGSAWVLQQGSQFCLRSDRVARRTVIDNRTVLFRMDDGTYWKNTLQHECTGLKMADGIKIVARDNYLCANEQPFTIMGTGVTCYLGDFSHAPAPH